MGDEKINPKDLKNEEKKGKGSSGDRTYRRTQQKEDRTMPVVTSKNFTASRDLRQLAKGGGLEYVTDQNQNGSQS